MQRISDTHGIDEKGDNIPGIILSATVPPKRGDGSGSSAGNPPKIELTRTQRLSREA